jgi:hypothetical protein
LEAVEPDLLRIVGRRGLKPSGRPRVSSYLRPTPAAHKAKKQKPKYYPPPGPAGPGSAKNARCSKEDGRPDPPTGPPEEGWRGWANNKNERLSKAGQRGAWIRGIGHRDDHPALQQRSPFHEIVTKHPTPCYAMVLPGRKTGFRAGCRPDSDLESLKIRTPAGRRPILQASRLESGRHPAGKPDFGPGSTSA